jgi:hypothetical protein
MRLLPNERNPCEWHFTFESLAAPDHSKRIHTLILDFDFLNEQIPHAERIEFALGSCQFFALTFPQLTSLGWKASEMRYPSHIFSNSPFTPTVRSLSFEGSWDGLFTQVNNLTSFTFMNYEDSVCAETLRLFMSNNRSLESLSLHIITFEGNPKGPPVDLLNLKSFSVVICPTILSTIVRVPALQRLSSLQTSYKGEFAPGPLRLLATGDGITLSVIAFPLDVAEVWQDIVGYARPTIHHIRLCDYPEGGPGHTRVSDNSTVVPLLADAHTLEVGRGYLPLWYHDFLDDLGELGPQLKTIRFEVWEEMEPFNEGYYEGEMYGRDILDDIEELVKYRFEIGRPFAAVERMVVCESERSNRQQDYVWRSFYSDRKLGQYVRPI